MYSVLGDLVEDDHLFRYCGHVYDHLFRYCGHVYSVQETWLKMITCSGIVVMCCVLEEDHLFRYCGHFV